MRVVEFDLGRFAKKVDALDEDEAAGEKKDAPQPGPDGFMKIPDGEPTPFEDDPQQLSLPY